MVGPAGVGRPAGRRLFLFCSVPSRGGIWSNPELYRIANGCVPLRQSPGASKSKSSLAIVPPCSASRRKKSNSSGVKSLVRSPVGRGMAGVERGGACGARWFPGVDCPGRFVLSPFGIPERFSAIYCLLRSFRALMILLWYCSCAIVPKNCCGTVKKSTMYRPIRSDRSKRNWRFAGSVVVKACSAISCCHCWIAARACPICSCASAAIVTMLKRRD